MTEIYQGIIIRLYPYAEADLVMRLLTKEVGKISVLAKHARKSKKRFGNNFDLLDRGVFNLRQGKGSLLLLETFNAAHAFQSTHKDLDKITLASILCDCTDLLTPEGTGDPSEAYETIELALLAIDSAPHAREALKALYFAIAHLLNVAGYGSEISAGAPSSAKLKKLLCFVEQCAERKLESKGSLDLVLNGLRAESANSSKA